MIRRTGIRSVLMLAVVAVLPTGCGGSLFRSTTPPASTYVLSARPETGLAPLPADLTVLRPLVRPGLDTERIAVLYPDRHLDYYAGARWNARLDEVVQDLAVQTLQARASQHGVTTDASAFATGYWLEIEVADFQAEYRAGAAAPTVHVHLRASLGRASDRRIVDRFDADATQAAGDNRLTPIVAAYEQAADAALGKIVADTVRSLQAGGGVSTPRP